MAEKVKVIQIETDAAQKSVKDLRNELKSLRDTLLTVDSSTVEYAQALQRAGNIQNQLREQMNMINASAMDFGQILGNITGSLAGVMSGMQAGIAVMNLFGIKNKEVIESLQKMQNIMALTQGIAGIEKGIKSVMNLTRAIKASTTAARLFSAALTPKGLLAVAAAIGLITTAVVKLREKLGSADLKVNVVYDESNYTVKDINNPYRSNATLQEIDKFITESLVKIKHNDFVVPGTNIKTNNFEEYIKYYTEYYKNLLSESELMDELNKERRYYLDRIRNSVGSTLGTSTYFYADDIIQLEKLVKLYRDESWTGKNGSGFGYTRGSELKDFVDSALTRPSFSYIKKYLDAIYDSSPDEFSWRTVLSAIFGKPDINTYDFYAEFNKIKPMYDAYKLYEESLDFNINSSNEIIKAANDAKQATLEAEEAEKNKKKAQEEAEKAAKQYQESEKRRIEDLKKSYTDLINEIERYGHSEEYLTLKDLKDSFDKKEEILKSQLEVDLKSAKSQEEVYNIEVEYQKNSLALWDEYYKQRDELADEFERKRLEEEENKRIEEINKLREQVDIQIGIVEKEYSSELYLNRKNQALILDEVASGFFRTTTSMEKALDDLAEEEIQRNIDALKKELEIENLGAEQKLQLMNELAQEEIRLNELVDQHHANRVQRELGRYSTLGYSVGEIFTNLGSLMEEGSEEAKALQIMGATINMLAGITAAVSGAFTTHSGPWDIAIAAAQAAAIATSGAITIAQMAKTTKENASSVGMSAASTALTLVAPVQYTQDVQGAELERSIASQKVYVLESDITDSQRKVSVVESEARF